MDSAGERFRRPCRRARFEPLQTAGYVANQSCPRSSARPYSRRRWRHIRRVSATDRHLSPGTGDTLSGTESSKNNCPPASKRRRRRSRSRPAKRCEARSTWGRHLSSSRRNRLITAFIARSRSPTPARRDRIAAESRSLQPVPSRASAFPPHSSRPGHRRG